MNFKFMICNNCENEEKEDSFFIFDSKNAPIVNKSKKADINIKSLISLSDNNSTNNLEIIEYPYSNNCTDNNADYIPEPLPPISKENIAPNQMKKNDFDDFLVKIKPPKLFTEGNSENKEPEKPKINAEKTEIKEQDKKEEKQEKKDIDQMMDIKSNSYEIKNSKNNSSLIDNEDNYLDNKALLKNYYSNCNSARYNKGNDKKDNLNYNNIENIIKEKNNNNDNSNENIKNENNLNKDINNNRNNEKQKIENTNNINENIKIDLNNNNYNDSIATNNQNNISNNIVGIKVVYPSPDKDFIKKNEEEMVINNYNKKTLKNKKAILKSSLNKKEEKQGKFTTKKLMKVKTNFRFNKNKNLISNVKNNSDFNIYMNNKNKKFTKSNNIIKNVKNDVSKGKFENKKMNVRTKFLSKKELCHNKPNIITENIGNKLGLEYYGIKTESSDNNNKVINLIKKRAKYLSNGYLNDLFVSNMSLEKRNTFSNIITKKKSKLNYSHISRPKTKTSINYESKTYSNPFATIYNKKIKKIFFGNIIN